jgi:hypothetical protein
MDDCAFAHRATKEEALLGRGGHQWLHGRRDGEIFFVGRFPLPNSGCSIWLSTPRPSRR